MKSSIAGQAWALFGDVAAGRGRRIVALAAAMVGAGLAEGALLAVLPKLLQATAPLAAVLGFVALAAVSAALGLLGGIGAAQLSRDYTRQWRLRLHSGALRARLDTPELDRPTETAHALSGECGQCGYATQIAIGGFASLVQALFALAAGFWIAPQFTLLALAIGAASALTLAPMQRRAHRAGAAMIGANRALHAVASENLSGRRLIKILAAESARERAFADAIDELDAAQSVQTSAGAVAQAAQKVLLSAATASAAVYALIEMRMNPLALIALVAVFARVMANGARLQDQARQFSRLTPVYTRLVERYAAFAAARESEALPLAPRLRDRLLFENVSYTHPGAAAPTIVEANLEIVAGEEVSLSGPSGAGKSTLADLALGLIAPTRGRILLDGRELDEPARVAWRHRVGYAPQEAYLFHDTIRVNLSLADPQADEATLGAALEAAAAEFVFALPDGLDTIVGERGTRLSGGERQRIALARALLRKPDLLALDEALNAIDSPTRARILANLQSWAAAAARLSIAHGDEAPSGVVVRVEAGRAAQV